MLGALYPLFQPLLSHVDPEQAHHAAIRALEVLPLPTPRADDPLLACEVMGMRFPNPVGLAAGFDKDARVADAMMRLGFGFVECGGVTPLPQAGNPRPRVFRLPRDGAVINRYGLNSQGMEAVAARLAQRQRNGILGINLGANKDSQDWVSDYVILVRTLGRFADFLTLNVSSPNTPGLRGLQAASALDPLIASVLEARAESAPQTRVLLKIAPDLDDDQLDAIVSVARARRIDGMIVSNTTLARPASLLDQTMAREAGGLSGKPLFEASTRILAKTYLRVERQFPLIGVGGIWDGEDAVAKIRAGASLVQLYSALVYRGPALVGEIKRALVSAVRASPGGDLAGMVGGEAQERAKA